MTNELKIYCPDCKTKYLLVETSRIEKGFETMVASQNQLHSLNSSIHGIGCLKCGCHSIYEIREDGSWGA